MGNRIDRVRNLWEKRMAKILFEKVWSLDNRELVKTLSPDLRSSQRKSVILEGSIANAALKLAIPTFISLLVAFLYNTVDTFFIAMINRKSTALISGMSLVTPIFFIFTALSSGLRIGISTIVARSIGAKNKWKLETCFSSTMAISVMLFLLTLSLGYIFYDDLIRFMAGKALTKEAVRAGSKFFFYLLPGFSLMLLGQAFIGILLGEGLTATVGIVMVISNLLNALLDPLFIFTFKMGIAGAALATTLSIAFTAVVLLYYIFSKKIATPIRFKISFIDKDTLSEIGRISLSQAFSMISVSLAFIILNHLVGTIGQQEMNSWGLCSRLDQFVYIPIFAISGANLILISQNYGAGNWNRVRTIYHRSIQYAVICLLALAFIYIIGAPVFFKIFSDVREVIDGSVLQVRIVTLSFIGEVFEIISTSAFQGMGRAVPAFSLAIIRMFCFAIPLSYLSVYGFSFGMIGIFASICIAHIGVAIISFLWVQYEFKKMNDSCGMRTIADETV
jgi:putative MATE family efflux protein